MKRVCLGVLAVSAMALGIGLYLVPLGLVANPNLIELRQSPVLALLAFLKMGAGLTAVAYGIIAPIALLKRVLLVGSGLLLLFF